MSRHHPVYGRIGKESTKDMPPPDLRRIPYTEVLDALITVGTEVMAMATDASDDWQEGAMWALRCFGRELGVQVQPQGDPPRDVQP